MNGHERSRPRAHAGRQSRIARNLIRGVNIRNDAETRFTDTFVASAPATVTEKMTSEGRERGYQRRDSKARIKGKGEGGRREMLERG